MFDGSQAGSKRTVNATKNACNIIDSLKQLDGAGVTELADYLDMSKSGVHKHLTTLAEQGFVTQDGGTYRLSLHLLTLGEYLRRKSVVYNVGYSEVDELADESGEYAFLVVEDGGKGYYVHMSKGDNAVETLAEVGMSVSLHSAASGKTILAHLPDEERDRIIDHSDLAPRTDKTVTSREQLRKELEEVRKEGVAYSDEENVGWTRAMASPILSVDDQILGAVGVSGPVSRLNGSRYDDELPEMVKQTANCIELKISMREHTDFTE